MLKDKPRISVIVPIFNVASFLPKCIESILTQSFADFELILVNDGSPDNAHNICLSYQKKDKRIIIVNKANGGLLSARKAGLEASRAEFISFVDGDDWVDRDYLQVMHQLIITNKVDLVITGHIREFEGKFEKILPYFKSGIYQDDSLNTIVENMIYSGTFCKHGISTYVWNKLFRKSLLESFLYEVPNEIVMGEDAAITYSYLSISKSLVISDGCYYYYRQRPNSIVKIIQSFDNELLQLSKLFNFLYMKLLDSYDLIKLHEDLSYYLYSQILVRTGGFFNRDIIYANLLPFSGLRNGDRVVVYSSGSFGQRLVKFNKCHEIFKLQKWVDFDYEESRKIGLDVDAIYSVADIDFDSIIIASIDNNFQEWLLREFKLLGINIEKVRDINTDINFIENYLSVIGFTKDFKYDKNE
jgi:glycosyltransferase involved in cell wall biosynthesis